jgi:hypothetical protein
MHGELERRRCRGAALTARLEEMQLALGHGRPRCP